MVFDPGQQVGGLRIEKELGRGAYGIVYLARDALIGRQVALKVLPGGDDAIAPEVREQVLTEARLIGNLNSPNIVTLYRLHAADDGGWMQEMELVDGGALEDVLTADEAAPLELAVRVFRGVCLALKAAHAARVIHGDIKPANVLFGSSSLVKLADFGLARMIEGQGTAVELHGEIAGTPAYMAPEVIAGAEAGMASDVWAAGVLLYRLLTGRLPFPAVTFMELMEGIRDLDPEPPGPEVPEALRDLLFRCLAKEAADRPTAAAAVDELDELVAAEARLDKVPVARERPTNVEAPATSIVGREADIEAVAEIFRDERARLVTLMGPGGIGKTRLSLEICRALLDRFEGGCWFADLSEIHDVDGVSHAVVQALGVQTAGDKEPAEFVAGVLQYRKPLLLVLDNFEQVLEHAQATVGLWLKRSPEVRFLVTSRALLSLGGERAHELQPLPTPSIASAAADLDATGAHAGIQLFVERAREAKPGFELDARNAVDVARICAELEGMPLAIELAAARVRIMQPAQIAKKLGQKFSLLKSTRRDVTARQKTLDGAIEWSYDLLEEWEKDAFLQACYFREGLSLEAAEEVIDLEAYDDAPLAMDVAQSLREKSLLTAYDTGQETRLGMYRAIREYGQRRWRKTAEAQRQDDLRRRHAAFYLALAESWNDQIFGRRSEEALDHIDLEVGNLARAHEWARDAGDAATAARAALAAAETMKVRRPSRQLAALLESALGPLGDQASEERVSLLTYLSAAGQMSGDWDRALASADEAVAMARDLGARQPLAHALLQQGEMRRSRGDLAGGGASFEEAGALARELDDRRVVAQSEGVRGMVLGEQGDLNGAFECFSSAEQIGREIGDSQTVARHVSNRGIVCESRGELPTAIACHREAEDISRRMRNQVRVAISLGNRANVHVQIGDVEAGLRCYKEAEAIAREAGAKQRIAQIVGNRGSVHSMQGEIDAALACYEEAEKISRELGDSRRIAITLAQRGSLLSGRGEFEDALQCYGEAEQIGRETGDKLLVAPNLCRRGVALDQLDRRDDAWEALRAGIAMYDEMNANRSLWYLSFKAIFASVTAERGDPDEARRLANEGLELANQLGITEDHPDPGVAKGLPILRRLAGA